MPFRLSRTDWFSTLNDIDRACVLAALIVLHEKSPMLSRPYADTITGARNRNMKELRVQSRGDARRRRFPAARIIQCT
ncbi:hypothetical protein HC231_15420 [Brenneria izadpanahii]|uniref:Uncharacterized protein n=1 Tax=Brenneria izadpanahii TaxID=2722756 RepID=A0ABX7V1V6_9GAMM|nr:hypothetical protein HC231_15420 [Brenneria izadpanahii]